MLHLLSKSKAIYTILTVRLVPVMYANLRAYKRRIEHSFDDDIDLTQQTIVTNPLEYSRRCSLYKNDDIWTLYKKICPNVQTLGDVLYEGYVASNDGPCVGILRSSNNKKFLEWLSYSMVIDRSRSIGSYLWHIGELTPMQSKVAIISQNRPEYLFVEQACYMYGFISVNLYTTYSPATISNLLERTQPEILVVDNLKRIELIENDLLKNKQIKQILVMDEIIDDNKKNKIRSISSIFKAMNKVNVRERPSVEPDSIATFIMTSGTTGEPKIAMLSHENLLAASKGSILRFEQAKMTRYINTRHCSVLPLAHVIERFVLVSILLRGIQVVFCPEAEKLVEYLSFVKPTQVVVVPRILNKVYDRVMTEASKSQWKLFLVQQALSRKESWWLSRLVFRKVKKLFGGEVIYMTIGAAPVTSEVLHFFRIALNIPLIKGYGQTETAACGTLTHFSDISNGTVGTPCTTAEIKLIDVPDTNYRNEINQGEICVRGPTVFKGYYKDEQHTRETIDDKGWLHTGDVGEWTNNGTLRIIDRTKNIFKLAQGIYIAPERLEDIFIRSRWVEQIFIDGISTEASVVAIVIPDEEFVRKNFKTAVGTFADLCKSEKLKEIIMSDLIRLARENKFKYFQIPSNIHLHSELFSLKNGLLTITLKTRRTNVRKHYEATIKSLYKTGITSSKDM